MIQRKQSIWLVLAAFVLGLLFIFPYGLQSLTAGGETVLNARNSMLLMVATPIGILFNLFVIFQFKNRPQQIKFIYLAMVLNLIFIALMVFDAQFSSPDKKLAIGLLGTQLYIGIFVPVVSMILQWLAIKGIQQDERLIRDADRLR